MFQELLGLGGLLEESDIPYMISTKAVLLYRELRLTRDIEVYLFGREVSFASPGDLIIHKIFA